MTTYGNLRVEVRVTVEVDGEDRTATGIEHADGWDVLGAADRAARTLLTNSLMTSLGWKREA